MQNAELIRHRREKHDEVMEVFKLTHVWSWLGCYESREDEASGGDRKLVHYRFFCPIPSS